MNEILTNGSEIKNRIIAELDNARQSIYLAMAWFTDRDIANTIIKAKQRISDIDIILSSNAQNETVKSMFLDAGIKVHAFNTGDERGIMHHKFCLIDGRLSINGSYNYSYNASTNNIENIHISDDHNIYSQLYSEFERIKYNIDHNLAVDEKTIEQRKLPQIMTTQGLVEIFSEQLHNLVYSATQIETTDYKKRGFETSKQTHGNIDIFRIEYADIKAVINSYATDESLGSKKNILTSNITNAFQNITRLTEDEKKHNLDIAERRYANSKQDLDERLQAIKQEIDILETGNDSTGEKGLLQVNKEIELNQLERKKIDDSMILKRFWMPGTIIVLIFLLVFICYLSVFFASALYKMLFEGNIIRNALQAGVNPGLPKLVDANAILKVYRQEGALFGFIATIFFMFPVLLSNIKLIGSERKIVNNLLFWVGLLIFDVIVAAMIAINTDEIKNLLKGTESNLKLWEVVKEGEFWMIFMFGMVPLIITHYLIEYITSAYRKSQREIVDADKHRKLKILDKDLLELNSNKELIEMKIQSKKEARTVLLNDLLLLRKNYNDEQIKIEHQYADIQRHLKSIYDDYDFRITSGRIFTDEIFRTVITAYRSGFVEYLPSFYATNEVSNRIREIEQIMSPQ